MDGDRLEITVEARLLWFLGLRECENPSGSISRRNFPPLPVDTAISSNRWRYVKGERRGRPSRDAGLVRASIVFHFSFLLIRTRIGLGLGLGLGLRSGFGF